ncbi:hypothetical protein MMC28_000345 [Mycoblastus sanguinarius]|nr:hypothetical protein [Mycoblastus sanguinarius]
MPHIEVLPNSTSIKAPGYAYVPEPGYGPSQAAAQPSSGRKRAARSTGLAGGDTSARQQNAVLKHLAELDKDSNRDIQIHLPAKQKDNIGKASKKTTQNVRRILMSQKTFANHLADEEAALAQQQHLGSSAQASRAATVKPIKSVPSLKRSTTSEAQSAPSESTHIDTVSTGEAAVLGNKDPLEDDPLLKTYIPCAPSDEVMEALLSGPPLSYNAARAAPPPPGKPQRHFCEICGYWGPIKCIKCGARVCGLECKGAHDDGRCLKFYA